MKGNNLKFATSGQAAVIGMAIAALLFAGCSKGPDSPKPDHRAASATNSARAHSVASNAFAEFRPTNASPTTTNEAIPEWALAPKKLAELKAKAEKGDAQAQFEFGTNRLVVAVMDDHVGVPEAITEAMNWWLKAAEGGHAEAAFFLASEYKHGRGKQGTNAILALHWLQVAAERGNLEAQVALARSCYTDWAGAWASSPAFSGVKLQEDWGTGQDLADAAKWYGKAAAQGDADSQSTLGEMYLRGEGVPTNTSEGLRLPYPIAPRFAPRFAGDSGLDISAAAPQLPHDFTTTLIETP